MQPTGQKRANDIVVQRETDTWARVIGTPIKVSGVTVPQGRSGCPACAGKTLAMYQVAVENDYLRSGKGIASYVKCSGCSWQSEMVVRNTG
jgi:hypothetical protein